MAAVSASAQTKAAAAIAAIIEPHDTFAEAWVAALKELTVVEANRTAKAGTFDYDYADLGDVVKATRGVLGKHGLVVDQDLIEHGAGLGVRTIVTHTSGELRGFGPLPFPFGRDAQATGSAITYHRRYALLAALGMAVGADDDDGATAVPAAPVKEIQGRTHAEALIRRHLATMAADDLKDFRAKFKSHFDSTLAQLPKDQHDDALTWVEAYIGKSLSEKERPV